MNQDRKRLLVLLGILGGLTTLIVAGACIGIYARLSRLPPPNFEFPDATVDYTYHLPPEAEIIEAKADTADIFGDFSMCVLFRLADREMGRLREEGLDWFPPIRRDDHSDNRLWEEGVLDEYTVSFVNEMLATDLSGSTTYTYINEWVDGGWHRLLVIDDEYGIVYYCRVSW